MKKRAFSLIELLVVIAIIGLLAGLLYPVLGRAKNKVREANCFSNLRQIGIAISIYADSHQSKLPSAEPIPSRSVDPALPLPSIVTLLKESLAGVTNVFRCPEDKAGWFTREGTSYEWNYLFNGKSLEDLTVGPGPIPVGSDVIFAGDMRLEAVNAPLLFDIDNFHLGGRSGSTNGVRAHKNALFADGHVGPLEKVLAGN